MATRAERVKEALDQVNGHEKVAYALALNEVALRRDYFNQVSGYGEAAVVKALAKLANAGVVGETDGLEFEVASKEIAKDIQEHVPGDSAREIHEASLVWAEERQVQDDKFVITHMIGASEYSLAADKVLSLRRQEEDAIKAKTWLKYLRQILDGILAGPQIDVDLAVEVGTQVVRDGYGLMKPKALTTILTSLQQLKLTPDLNAQVSSTEGWLKSERSRARVAAKAQSAPASPAEGQQILLENPQQGATQ